MRILRLAHFSDFHLKDFGPDFERSLFLIDDAISRGVDHLMLTGDLVDAAEMDVVAAFISELDGMGWGTSDKLTIIPGNHDIFPVAFKSLLSARFRHRRPSSLGEEFIDLTRRSRTGKGCRKLLRGETYPFGKVLDDRVVVVGLDTTRKGQYNPRRWAEGELPESDMRAADRFLSAHADATHRLIVMHHHPWKEELIGGDWIDQNFTTPPPEEVFDWIEESGANLVLCGHVHSLDAVERRRFKGGLIFRAGTAGGDHDVCDGDRRRGYHLIDLHENGRVAIQERMFWDSELDDLGIGES